MLYWHNPFPIYDATYIFKVYPRKKTSGMYRYYTTFFWGNDGAFSWDGGFPNTYYGGHPYPRPASRHGWPFFIRGPRYGHRPRKRSGCPVHPRTVSGLDWVLRGLSQSSGRHTHRPHRRARPAERAPGISHHDNAASER